MRAALFSALFTVTAVSGQSCQVAQFSDTCTTYAAPVAPACCAALVGYQGAHSTNTLVNSTAKRTAFCADCLAAKNVGIQLAEDHSCGPHTRTPPFPDANASAPATQNPCSVNATCKLTAYDTKSTGKNEIHLTGDVPTTCCDAAQDFYRFGGHDLPAKVRVAFCSACRSSANTFIEKTFTWYAVDCSVPPAAVGCKSAQFFDTCETFAAPVAPTCCAAIAGYQGAHATNTLVNPAAAQELFCAKCSQATNDGVMHESAKYCKAGAPLLPAKTDAPANPSPCINASVTCTLTAYNRVAALSLTGYVPPTCCAAAQDFYRKGGQNESADVRDAFCFSCASSNNTFILNTFKWYKIDCNAPPPPPPPPTQSCPAAQFPDTCSTFAAIEPDCCAAYKSYFGAYVTNTLGSGAAADAAQLKFCNTCESSTNIGIQRARGGEACGSTHPPLNSNNSLPALPNPCKVNSTCELQAYDQAVSGKQSISLTGDLTATCCDAAQTFYKLGGHNVPPHVITSFCSACSKVENEFIKHTFSWYNVDCNGPPPPPPAPKPPSPPAACAAPQFADACETLEKVAPACCKAYQGYFGAYRINSLGTQVEAKAAQSAFCSSCHSSTNVGIAHAYGNWAECFESTLKSNTSKPKLANPCAAPATCELQAYDTADSGKTSVALTGEVNARCCHAAQAFYKLGGHKQNYRITGEFCAACSAVQNEFIKKSFTWYKVDCTPPPLPNNHTPQPTKKKSKAGDVILYIILGCAVGSIVLVVIGLCRSKRSKSDMLTPINQGNMDYPSVVSEPRAW